ncbi:MAG TPA: acriflavin resistance protein [Bradyrhizobium sp.]|nr:acriflavin resistance protein [Bradyrhizobium sp.]
MTILAGRAGFTAPGLTEAPDSWTGLLTSGLAGAAAATAVAIVLTLYFREQYRSPRDIARGLAASLVAVALLGFVAYDMRHAAFDYLGINSAKPAVEFEIRLPNAAALAVMAGGTQIELHTDKNQTLAKLREGLASTEDGRTVLRGSVPLDFRTTDRIVVLNLPGQPQRLFKLRLAASPSHSDQFGPWHLADRVTPATANEPVRTTPNDAFAIRYRVL